MNLALRTAILLLGGIWLVLALWLPFFHNKLFPTQLSSELRPELYTEVSVEPNPWLEAWQRWDSLYDQAIAERGYTAFDSPLFTPPLYPLLMRWIAGFSCHPKLHPYP